ncbi:hypothetical protein PG991_012859 [Apiospora marii]|uniref:Uncharacterized protein n=1 Tax=Apiospora marii TaxID=335849 RepID=A0ABR1RB99_9PEZI
MAPATLLGFMDMEGQSTKKDPVMTTNISDKMAAANQVHTKCAVDACKALEGTLANKMGSTSDKIAVNATIPR